jgi:hypothetical protein
MEFVLALVEDRVGQVFLDDIGLLWVKVERGWDRGAGRREEVDVHAAVPTGGFEDPPFFFSFLSSPFIEPFLDFVGTQDVGLKPWEGDLCHETGQVTLFFQNGAVGQSILDKGSVMLLLQVPWQVCLPDKVEGLLWLCVCCCCGCCCCWVPVYKCEEVCG